MNNIMVCVTLQSTCEKLIRAASKLRRDDDALSVLHVAKSGQPYMGETNNAKTLEYLYSVSNEYGADMTVLNSDSPIETIINFIEEHNINTVVLGIPAKHEKDNGFIREINKKLANKCQLVLIDKEKGDF